MKPPPFRYEAPETLEEALALLAEHGDEAKVLAGGQSLVPMMNFRLARPEVVVDIGRVPDLDRIRTTDGHVVIGTKVRHRELEHPPFAGPLGSLVSRAAHHVGHLPIRLRGTFGGSLAHADPAAEWCILARALDAQVRVRGPSSERVVDAGDFFETVFTTVLEPDEIVTEVVLPHLDDRWRTGLSELSRRAGDFAIVAVMSAIRVDDDRITDARIAVGGVAGTPVRLPEAERELIGAAPTAEAFATAAAAGAAAVDPAGDIHGSGEYRRDLVRVLTERALSS